MWFRFKFRNPDETIPRWEPLGTSTHGRNMRISDLEDAICLSDDDCLLMVDVSENKSVKVKLGALREYFRRN